MSTLVCTLGLSWAVIAECYASLAPRRTAAFDGCRRPGLEDLPEPSAIHVVTTAGTKESCRQLSRWWKAIGCPVPLRLTVIAPTDGAGQAEVALAREAILRAVLQAGADCMCCLAGGRKTMSADLQRAAGILGARAIVHVIADPPAGLKPTRWFAAMDEALLGNRPLTTRQSASIQVVRIGTGTRAAWLDVPPVISPARWPVAEGSYAGDGRSLHDELNRRERDSAALMVNLQAGIARQEHHENWRSLYLLPVSRIRVL